MATNTTRLALIKPDGSEPRSKDSINTNSNLIDKFMPCILVNDGVTPPTGDLYDGALVKEKTSGIIWEARKNGGGTFDKVYVRYPWVIQAYTGDTSLTSSTTFAEWGVTTWSSGKNSSAANINGSNKIVLPIKGIYSVRWRYRFNTNGTGNRCARLVIDGTSEGNNTEITIPGNPNGYVGIDLTATRLFNASTTITGERWQNSGGGLNVYTLAEIAMLEPVQ